MNNPYHAPAANLDSDHEPVDAYQPDVLSLSGRIGRVRFICYSFWMGVAAFFGLSLVLVPFDRGANSELVGYIAIALMIAVSIVYTVRRLHDMGWSGWWAVLCALPPISVLVWIWMALGPGDAQANRFGPPPVRNEWPPILGAVLVPVIPAVLAALAALVIIPAYQSITKNREGDKSRPTPARTEQRRQAEPEVAREVEREVAPEGAPDLQPESRPGQQPPQ